MIFFSIIIPTWKRKILLKEIIVKLLKQNFNYDFEIIICDSNSNDGTKKIIQDLEKTTNKIKYINIIQNSLPEKRNIGIKSAKGKYIILMDDDCIPANNYFLKEYFREFNNNINKNIILNGTVSFPKDFIKKSNFIKYRQSRHFSKDRRLKLWNNELNLKHLVVMNMAFPKNQVLNKKIMFNTNFWGYGSEDHDFAQQLKSGGFVLKACAAEIIHFDKASYSSYLTKIYHFGRDGMLYLKEFNTEAYEEIFLEKITFNFLKRKIFKSILNKTLVMMIKFEKKIFFNFPIYYQVGIFLSFLLGSIDRKHSSKEIIKRKAGWYTKKYS
ncbi:glycosyltransferase [Candidatus Pelagibacter sp.]|nr:glycosyltransferase [Candidatus Pelagibacter sp.]